MKRNKIFLGLMILALALTAIAMQLLTNPKLRYNVTAPKSYAECAEASGQILESYPSRCVYNGQGFTNPDEQVQAPPSDIRRQQTTLQQYIDSAAGFGFQYPTDIFVSGHAQVKLPWKNKSIDSLLLTHSVPLQHCDLSGLPGHCTDTTTDISIAFTPLEASLADIVAAGKTAPGPMEDISWGDITAKTATFAVEGEGNVYYFLALSKTKTLMITRSFISEAVVAGYQDKPGFLVSSKQEQIFNNLMATFKLGPSALSTNH